MVLASLTLTLELGTRLTFESNTVFNINIGTFKAYHPTRGVQFGLRYEAGVTDR